MTTFGVLALEIFVFCCCDALGFGADFLTAAPAVTAIAEAATAATEELQLLLPLLSPACVSKNYELAARARAPSRERPSRCSASR